MDYEKKYKEALERARIWQNHLYDTNDRDYADELNYIFPELAESGDEKIRKQILSFLKEFEYDHYRNLDFSSWITWLEKQGRKKSIDYTRTNVFTEKAAIWFNNNFIVHDEYGVISDSFDTKEEMFEDFKNYMKEE